MASRRSHSGTSYTSRTNTTLAAPSGIVDGDELYLFFLLGASSKAAVDAITPTFPSGFATVGGPYSVSQDGDTGQFTVNSWVLRKRASGESGSYTITHATASSDGFMWCVQDAADDSTPELAQNSGSGVPENLTYGTVSVAGSSAYLTMFAHNWNLWGTGSVPSTGTGAGTLSEIQDSASSLIYVADSTTASIGAVSGYTQPQLSGGGTGNRWVSVAVVLENGDPTVPSLSKPNWKLHPKPKLRYTRR